MPYPINQRAHQFNSIQSVPVSFGLWDTALKFLSPGPRNDVTDHLDTLTLVSTSLQWPLSSVLKVAIVEWFDCNPPFGDLYGVADFFRLQLYERIGFSQVEVYEKVGRSVI